MPDIPPEEFLKPAKARRQIKGKQLKNHVSYTCNIIDRYIINNDRGFAVDNCKTEQLKNSFFVKTVIEWNHLITKTVRAGTAVSGGSFTPNDHQLWTPPVSRYHDLPTRTGTDRNGLSWIPKRTL